MKRTITRYVSEESYKKILAGATGNRDHYELRLDRCPHRLDLTVDDGQSEPKPETEDRVVEGWINHANMSGIDNTGSGVFNRYTLWTHPNDAAHDANYRIPATLIIHEPVKEPTLYELIAQYLEKPNVFPGWHAIEAAFAREKAKR